MAYSVADVLRKSDGAKANRKIDFFAGPYVWPSRKMNNRERTLAALNDTPDSLEAQEAVGDCYARLIYVKTGIYPTIVAVKEYIIFTMNWQKRSREREAAEVAEMRAKGLWVPKIR